MDNLLVDSSPSKEFFLSMITKDVTVESCIMDLIDNSIDAHKRMKKGKTESVIDISYSLKEDYFSICDDCGGMSKDIAMKRAFRFGNDMERSSGTLGMYGIGMKRSIFKIGNDFIVESKTKDDSYKVYMDHDEWINLKSESTKDDLWKFHLDDVKLDFKDGVHIKISNLSDSLKNYLKYPYNIKTLKEKIGSSYGELLSNGITIKINGEKVIYSAEFLYEADFLKSHVKTLNINNSIKIKIVAGVGDASPKDAGWNIICNGRAVIQKDRTELTGWESSYELEDEDDIDNKLKEKALPAFHNDFARFRGYIYIDADDSNKLPLNTTKDSIDKQHPIYQLIFDEMRSAMKEILPSLRKLQEVIRKCKNEAKVPPNENFIKKRLTDYFSEDRIVFLLQLDDFHASDIKKNIPMYIDAKTVEKLKIYFEVEKNTLLGEKIKEFVLERVILDE